MKLGIVFVFISGALLLTSVPSYSQGCPDPSGDSFYEQFKSDFSSIFYDRPAKLYSRGSIDKSEFDKLQGRKLIVCSNEIPDAWLADGNVVVSLSFLVKMFEYSNQLLLGQNISYRLPDVPPTIILGNVLRREYDDLLSGGFSKISIYEIVDEVTNGRRDLAASPPGRDFVNDWAGLYVQALGFLMLHEQCHIFLDHAEKRMALKDEGKFQAIQQQEIDADACAIVINSRDERHLGGTPGAAHIGAFIFLLTSLVYEKAFYEAEGGKFISTHPTTVERLRAMEKLVSSELSGLSDVDPRSFATLTHLTDFHGRYLNQN